MTNERTETTRLGKEISVVTCEGTVKNYTTISLLPCHVTGKCRCCLWLDFRCPAKMLFAPLMDRMGKRKYERLVGQEKDKEGSITNDCHKQNRLHLAKDVFDLLPIKSV